jgi:hypothetical protein
MGGGGYMKYVFSFPRNQDWSLDGLMQGSMHLTAFVYLIQCMGMKRARHKKQTFGKMGKPVYNVSEC